MGVLVSVTNLGDNPSVVGFDKVNLDQLNLDPFKTEKQPLNGSIPNSIDRIRRERGMWDLTMNRPWLANMQKTRSVRGLVPPNQHDLFRGPNIFGVYGEWSAASRILPERVAAITSPERVQDQVENTVDAGGLVRSNTIKTTTLVPATLDPFESRTGELFYLNPRCESVMLTVRVGNASFELPFH